MGSPISWETWARLGSVHFKQTDSLGPLQTQPALQQEVTLLLDSMPAS